MKWLIDEIGAVLNQLKHWQTWLGIGLIGMFAGLAYLVATFAFKTDAILVFMHRTGASCREMTNGIIIALFCGMIFFAFSAVLTLGEVQRYLQYKQRAAHHQTRQSLIWGVVWGMVAMSIAVSALVFFNQYCR